MTTFNPPKEPAVRPIMPPNQLAGLDFSACKTPAARLNPINNLSAYVSKLMQAIAAGNDAVLPTLTRVIEKRGKAMLTLATFGTLASAELTRKAKTKKEKALRKAGNNHVMRYGRIKTSDCRSCTAVRNEAEDAEVEAIRVRTLEQKRVKTEKEQLDLLVIRVDSRIKKYSDSLKLYEYGEEESQGVWGHQPHLPKPRHVIISVQKVLVRNQIQLNTHFKDGDSLRNLDPLEPELSLVPCPCHLVVRALSPSLRFNAWTRG